MRTLVGGNIVELVTTGAVGDQVARQVAIGTGRGFGVHRVVSTVGYGSVLAVGGEGEIGLIGESAVAEAAERGGEGVRPAGLVALPRRAERRSARDRCIGG